MKLKRRKRYGRATKTWRTYTAWVGMKQRIKTARYKKRGITICTRWNVFTNFLYDMGECPPGLTLDRVNNNGNYTPKNCRWISMEKQNWNKSDTLTIFRNGHSWNVRDIVAITGLNPHTIRWRMQRRPNDWHYITMKLSPGKRIPLMREIA